MKVQLSLIGVNELLGRGGTDNLSIYMGLDGERT